MSSYPVPMPGDDDPRFTIGLLDDVRKVIAAHGYPPVRDAEDLTRLRQALYRFIYMQGGSP